MKYYNICYFGDMENKEIVIGGDFNVRTGELDNVEWEEEIERSKDKVIENEGRVGRLDTKKRMIHFK